MEPLKKAILKLKEKGGRVMKTKLSVIGGIAACTLMGAGIGYIMKTAKPKRKPMHKTAGQALKSVGTMIEHMNF